MKGEAGTCARGPRPTLVYMLGSTDVGKTYTVTKIANICYERGMGVAIVDADVGQSDIGPPCCIGMGTVNKRVRNLHDVPPRSLYFIGDTSPVGCIRECLRGITAAVRDAKALSPDIILVDSTGWIEGEDARRFKLREITQVEPTLVIAIERAGELDEILMRLLLNRANQDKGTDISLFRLHADDRVERRTLEDRRRIRAESYRRYFRGAKWRIFELDIYGHQLGSGTRSDMREQLEYGRLVGLFATDEDRDRDKDRGGARGRGTDTRGDEGERCLGLGIFGCMDEGDNAMMIYTPVEEVEDVSSLRLARVKLRLPGYEEQRSG